MGSASQEQLILGASALCTPLTNINVGKKPWSSSHYSSVVSTEACYWIGPRFKFGQGIELLILNNKELLKFPQITQINISHCLAIL